MPWVMCLPFVLIEITHGVKHVQHTTHSCLWTKYKTKWYNLTLKMICTDETGHYNMIYGSFSFILGLEC